MPTPSLIYEVVFAMGGSICMRLLKMIIISSWYKNGATFLDLLQDFVVAKQCSSENDSVKVQSVGVQLILNHMVHGDLFPQNVMLTSTMGVQLILEHIHGQAVVHGDLFPQNVILTSKGTIKIILCGGAIDVTVKRHYKIIFNFP